MTTDRLPFMLLVCAPLACDQPPPPSMSGDEVGVVETSGESGIADEDDGSGEADDTNTTGSDTEDIEDSLYPLVDGARWTYVVKNTFGQILDTQTMEFHPTVWKGMEAWKLVDEPDLQGAWDESTIIRQGSLALRVHRKELTDFGPTEIIDYDPGFLRANQAWATAAVGYQEELDYTRTAYDGGGQFPDAEARAHTYEVLAVDEPVTVPAGTFSCVKVERVRTLGAEAGALVWFWFAPGIGKVREERPIEMEIEELVSVTIPGGASFP